MCVFKHLLYEFNLRDGTNGHRIPYPCREFCTRTPITLNSDTTKQRNFSGQQEN